MGEFILPPTINPGTLHDIDTYITLGGTKVDTPWSSQKFPNFSPICTEVLEFCPEHGAGRDSIDYVAECLLQLRSDNPPISAYVPQSFVSKVYKLTDLVDYLEGSWRVFQDFLSSPAPIPYNTTMETLLPAFPVHDESGTLIIGTGEEETHFSVNFVKKVINSLNGKYYFLIEDYDSNQYGSATSSEFFYRRQRVLCYISVFSYLKAIGANNGKKAVQYEYPGPDWATDLMTIHFLGCSFKDRITTCQLGGSCFLHGIYHLMRHIVGQSLLLPPLNELEQLMYGGLVLLNYLRTGEICTSYPHYIFHEVYSMREWRKCLLLGTESKLEDLKQDQSLFKQIVTTVQFVTTTNYPPPPAAFDASSDCLKDLFTANVFKYCKDPSIGNHQTFHFWTSTFTSMALRYIIRTESTNIDPLIQVLEPRNGIRWYSSQVDDPIEWSLVQNFHDNYNPGVNSTTTNSPLDPLQRIRVFPIVKDKMWALVAFVLTYNWEGTEMQRTLLVVDSETAFSVNDRSILLKFILVAKIKNGIEACQDLNLQDFVIQYVHFEKPLLWQEQCCSSYSRGDENKNSQDGDDDGEEEPCKHWQIAANLSVLYTLTKMQNCFFTRQIDDPQRPTYLKRFGCESFNRLSALESLAAVISEIAPFTFALILSEYFDD